MSGCALGPRAACTLAGLLFVVSLAGGCSYSTEYVPKRADRIALTLEDDRYVFRKGTATTPVSLAPDWGFGPEQARSRVLFDCDPEAFEHYLLAQERFEIAQLLFWGRAAALIVTALALPISPLVIWVAAILDVLQGSQRSAGMALAVDAMNLHNDAAACAGRPEPEPEPEPELAPEPERPDALPGSDPPEIAPRDPALDEEPK